jgi:hypothetical protein
MCISVIPAKAGIHVSTNEIDAKLHVKPNAGDRPAQPQSRNLKKRTQFVINSTLRKLVRTFARFSSLPSHKSKTRSDIMCARRFEKRTRFDTPHYGTVSYDNPLILCRVHPYPSLVSIKVTASAQINAAENERVQPPRMESDGASGRALPVAADREIPLIGIGVYRRASAVSTLVRTNPYCVHPC